MQKMNPEIKARWLTALRSGDYKQGRQYLRDCEDNFCCLGVLCEVVREDICGDWIEEPRGSFAPCYRFDDAVAILPCSVQVAADIQNPTGHFGPEYDDSLVHLNDGGATFDEIADIIEANF